MTVDPARFLELEDGAVVSLPPDDGLPTSVHVLDQASIDAINAALAIGRPLLVRGDPGTGKSQLARAAARALRRRFRVHVVDGSTETRDLLWRVDAVARLAQAQVLGALHGVTEADAHRRLEVQRFIEPGPLWWGFDWDGAAFQQELRGGRVADGGARPVPGREREPREACVVLIDEIDKADASVPNGLLDALGNGSFDVDGVGCVGMDRARPPLVVITTNEERALPDAFLRRCLVLQLALPAERGLLIDVLVARGEAHFGDRCGVDVLIRAAEMLADDRDEMKSRDVAAPGLAEFVDLVGVVVARADADAERIAMLDRVRQFALRKHPDEQA